MRLTTLVVSAAAPHHSSPTPIASWRTTLAAMRLLWISQNGAAAGSKYTSERGRRRAVVAKNAPGICAINARCCGGEGEIDSGLRPSPFGRPPGVQNRCRDFVEPRLRLAERVGFEPTVGLLQRRFSRPVHSTALPPLHIITINQLQCLSHVFLYTLKRILPDMRRECAVSPSGIREVDGKPRILPHPKSIGVWNADRQPLRHRVHRCFSIRLRRCAGLAAGSTTDMEHETRRQCVREDRDRQARSGTASASCLRIDASPSWALALRASASASCLRIDASPSWALALRAPCGRRLRHPASALNAPPVPPYRCLPG